MYGKLRHTVYDLKESSLSNVFRLIQSLPSLFSVVRSLFPITQGQNRDPTNSNSKYLIHSVSCVNFSSWISKINKKLQKDSERFSGGT